MRLLICTQAVDCDDPVLGFFHRWIEEVAKRSTSVHVICLKEGRHALPANVHVHSLGKESGGSRMKYVVRFFRSVWDLRNEYDAVLVHMNEEYVLLAGIAWLFWGKRVVLWRNHKMGSWRTRLAVLCAHVVCHTSPEAYVAQFSNARIMPIGIDTTRFAPKETPPDAGTILFFGRLDAVKNPETFLLAMQLIAGSNSSAHANVYGDPSPGRESYAADLKKRFSSLQNVTFHGAVTNERAPEIYRAHAIYVNATPSGSFDKTIGEAMAAGCIVIASNAAVQSVLHPDVFVANPKSPENLARALRAALSLSLEEQRSEAARLQTWVRENHSLELLMRRLQDTLCK